MNKRRQTGVFLVAAVLAGAAGFFLNRGSTTSPVADGAGQKLMLVSLYDLSGKSQMMSQWSGNVLVVNFWAIWYALRLEEIPALMRVQHIYASNGVQFVGIALDNVSKVRDYAEEMRIDYTLLIGGIEALAVTKDLGNREGGVALYPSAGPCRKGGTRSCRGADREHIGRGALPHCSNATNRKTRF